MRTKSLRSGSFIRSIFIVALILMMSHLLYSQSILSGLGIEVGGGYNQLFWKAPIPTPQSDYVSYNRTHFSLTPMVRLKYDISLPNEFAISPFVGYNRFGGQGYKEANGYQDEIWFDAFNVGFLASYQISNLSIGVGYEVNRHQKITSRYFGSANMGASPNQQWDEHDGTQFLARWSHDLGLRASYRISHFSLSFESWFGISALEGDGVFSPAKVRQNYFRALLGYTI